MKRYSFKLNRAAHITAISAALLLHLILLLWLTWPSKPIVLEQAIRVTMVAPSLEKEVEKSATIKLRQSFIKSKSQVKTHEVAKIEKEKLKKPEPEKKKEVVKKSSQDFQTSGQVDQKSLEKTSAKSEPIFDAAYLQNPAPHYPFDAKRKGQHGKVMLKVKVTKSGTAALVEVFKTSGYSSLDEAAKNAVEDWRFVPAYIGAEAVEAVVLVPIEFQLD
ncbi:MAG: energy transducer TonB [Rickettsiales bacterium]|nr:energy transducer TonB [Rickettsiales bacterium]